VLVVGDSHFIYITTEIYRERLKKSSTEGQPKNEVEVIGDPKKTKRSAKDKGISTYQAKRLTGGE